MRLIVCCKDAFTSHVCILHVRVAFVFLLLACLCLYVGCKVIVCAFAVVCREVAFQITSRVDCMCVLFSCVLSYVCACMFVSRMIVYAFAFACCKVEFQITRVRRLRVFGCFRVFGLFVCACMFFE